MNSFHVDSEVGVLRRVLLHRPDLELRRLTPSNCSDLLFDDVLWVRRARQEHDAFADVLTDRGVEVLYVAELLAETVKDDTARGWVLDRVITERELGRELAMPVRDFFDTADPITVATHLIGGITTAELPKGTGRGLRAAVLGDDGFVLPPLPNHMFTRDTTCWIYGGVSVNPMAMAARMRETAHLEAIYRFHPTFADETFSRWYGGVDIDHGSATIEGGDVLVVGNGAVLIGMGERTTPQAVERLARSLFSAGAATTVIPVALPAKRAFMHLDTVMTMVRPDTFVAYPGVLESLRTWTLTPGAAPDELVLTEQPDVFTPVRDVLGIDDIRVLTTGGDTSEAEREQWDDGNNVLAIAACVAIAYERNVDTNTKLRKAGIEVITIAGSELGRGPRRAPLHELPPHPRPGLITGHRAMKDLLRIADLSPEDLELLLDLSDDIHRDPHLFVGLSEGDTVITYFAKPSTRTRLSFGSAITHLGGTPEVVGPNELQLGRGETIEDTARVISRYARAFVIRTFSDDERAECAAALQPYQVNPTVMAAASPGAVFMHCLPADRGEEVKASVIDGPASVVLDEAENRMHTAEALLIALSLGQLAGAASIESGAV